MLKEWQQHLLFPAGKKDQRQKIQVSFPDVTKMQNKGMCGFDLIDQMAEACHLNQRSTIRFYLRIFFDFRDIVCANSYIVYNMMHPNDLTLLNFKTIASTYLIGR